MARHPNPTDTLSYSENGGDSELANDWPIFKRELAEANLRRMWWLLIGSTAISTALVLLNLSEPGVASLSGWQTFDLAASAVFFILFWLGQKGRLPARMKWFLGPAYFAFWLALMDGYYFRALSVYGETATYALGAITPAILIILPPRIFLSLLLSNHVLFTVLVSGARFVPVRSVEQTMASFFNGSLGVFIAALAAWFLYGATRANFRKERHVRLQEQLARLAEARVRAILENIPFQAWLKDTDSRFMAVNQEFLRGHNLPEEAIIFKSVEEVYGEERGRKYRLEEDEIIRTGKKAHFEQVIESRNGTRWYEIFKHPVCDMNGAVTGVAGLARDITSRKEIESRLLAADRAKSEFLAAMSHEIRTPMNSVLGYAGLLDSMIEDPLQRKYLHCITESGEMLLTIINDILDLSRIEAGTLRLDRQPVKLTGLVDHVRRIFEPMADEKGLDFRLVMETEVPERILGDTARIKQIVVNLISNAVKFTERGHISIRISLAEAASDPKPFLAIEVADTGIGIAPENIERLFRPFCQIDTSIARKFGGTGLGLVIAQNLAQNMGGDVTVTSKMGVGTIFTVTLPIEVPSEPDLAPENRETRTDEIELTGRSVLVVEDNRSNRGLVAAMLRRWGLKATLVTNGIEAIEAVANQLFDAVLMDVQMPEMDGFETTRRIRDWERTQPERKKSWIIACTALAMKGDEARCREAGMDDYVIKPLNVDDLRRALGRAIGG